MYRRGRSVPQPRRSYSRARGRNNDNNQEWLYRCMRGDGGDLVPPGNLDVMRNFKQNKEETFVGIILESIGEGSQFKSPFLHTSTRLSTAIKWLNLGRTRRSDRNYLVRIKRDTLPQECVIDMSAKIFQERVITPAVLPHVQERLRHAELARLDLEVLLCWRGSLPDNVVVDTIDEDGNVLHTGFPSDLAARQKASDDVIKTQTMVHTGAAARAHTPDARKPPKAQSPWDEEFIAKTSSFAISPADGSRAASSQQLPPTPAWWESQHDAAPASSQPCVPGPPWLDARVEQRHAEIKMRAEMQEAEELRRVTMNCEEWAREVEICQQAEARIAAAREDLAVQRRQMYLQELTFEMQSVEEEMEHLKQEQEMRDQRQRRTNDEQTEVLWSLAFMEHEVMDREAAEAREREELRAQQEELRAQQERKETAMMWREEQKKLEEGQALAESRQQSPEERPGHAASSQKGQQGRAASSQSGQAVADHRSVPVCSDELQQWLAQHTLEEVHGRDQYGWSALHHVAQNSRSDQAAERIFYELCTHGWSPEQLDYVTGQNVPDSMHLPKGWTALHLLANGGGDSSALRRRMAARLLMMRANPMARTETGATPLHTAAGTANADIVSLLLLEARATVNSKNKNKKTPFDMARSNKQVRDMIAAAGGIPSNDYTGGSARDLPNARAGTSYARQQRAAEWRNRG